MPPRGHFPARMSPYSGSTACCKRCLGEVSTTSLSIAGLCIDIESCTARVSHFLRKERKGDHHPAKEAAVKKPEPPHKPPASQPQTRAVKPVAKHPEPVNDKLAAFARAVADGTTKLDQRLDGDGMLVCSGASEGLGCCGGRVEDVVGYQAQVQAQLLVAVCLPVGRAFLTELNARKEAGKPPANKALLLWFDQRKDPKAWDRAHDMVFGRPDKQAAAK